MTLNQLIALLDVFSESNNKISGINIVNGINPYSFSCTIAMDARMINMAVGIQ